MRKLITIALAGLVLLSCNKDEVPGVDQLSSDSMSVSFQAYMSSVKTKGTAVTTASFQSKGLGVFAFHQAATGGVRNLFNSKNFTNPGFMYNQKVEFNTLVSGGWGYTPVKYWPNTENDLLSFFAYAPYESGQKWQSLGVSTDNYATKLTASFEISDILDKQSDLLWADPMINQSNKKDGNVNDLTKKITFNFRHLTSKIGILLGVDNPSVSGTAPEEWAQYPNTDITVEYITFKNLHNTFTVSYPIGKDGQLQTTSVSYESKGSIEVVANPYVSSDTPSVNFGLIDETWQSGWHNFLKAPQSLFVSSSLATDYLFLAPQDFKNQEATVTICYTVKTTADNSLNNSEITNVIDKKMSEIFPDGLESGKAYTLQFLIGMDDVNIMASVDDWADPTIYDGDFPGNDGYAVFNPDSGLAGDGGFLDGGSPLTVN